MSDGADVGLLAENCMTDSTIHDIKLGLLEDPLFSDNLP